MGIFLKHLWLIANLIKWQDCKIFTNLVLSQTPSRSSHRKCSVKKGVLKSFANLTGKHVCWSLFLIKLQIFIKKRLQYTCFPVKFAKFLRTSTLKNICERLLLPFLRFTKFNINFFLWVSWRHRFLYNKLPPLLSSKKVKDKNAFKHLNSVIWYSLKFIHWPF